MTIEEAANSLAKHLAEPDVFTVTVDKDKLKVDVEFIYRVGDIEKLNGQWEGFPVFIGRCSCW